MRVHLMTYISASAACMRHTTLLGERGGGGHIPTAAFSSIFFTLPIFWLILTLAFGILQQKWL